MKFLILESVRANGKFVDVQEKIVDVDEIIDACASNADQVWEALHKRGIYPMLWRRATEKDEWTIGS